jgi:hypothetical protein
MRLRGTTLYSAWWHSSARTRHTLTDFEALHILPERNDGARGGITKRHRLVESVEGGLHGGKRLRVWLYPAPAFTRSGRERALPTRDFSANSTTMRSVPAETRLDSKPSQAPALARGGDGHIFDGWLVQFLCFAKVVSWTKVYPLQSEMTNVTFSVKENFNY